MYARELIDPTELESLRQQYNVEFEKVNALIFLALIKYIILCF